MGNDVDIQGAECYFSDRENDFGKIVFLKTTRRGGRMKVLCFGSLNIDYTYKVAHFVGKGETISSDGLKVFAGGKGLNQAIALSRASAATYHAGAVGEDGRFLLTLLQEAGVHTEHVKILDTVRSGNAIIQNDSQGDNCIILYGGANQAITRAQVDEVLSHFEKGDFIVLQNEINELAYIMEKAHERGLVIVLNPSPMNEKILGLPLSCVDCVLPDFKSAVSVYPDSDYDGGCLHGGLAVLCHHL